MTVAEFQSLPLLLSRSEAMQVLGVTNKKTLEAIRTGHPPIAVRLPGTTRWSYRKVELAKLAGVTLDRCAG